VGLALEARVEGTPRAGEVAARTAAVVEALGVAEIVAGTVGNFVCRRVS
jgi:hypothetical protein